MTLSIQDAKGRVPKLVFTDISVFFMAMSSRVRVVWDITVYAGRGRILIFCTSGIWKNLGILCISSLKNYKNNNIIKETGSGSFLHRGEEYG